MSTRTAVHAVAHETMTLLLSPAGASAALLILPPAGLLTGMGMVTAYGEFHGLDLPDRLLLHQDGGYSEIFEYFLTGSSALAMLAVWHRTRIAAYMVLALFFGWLTADNSLQMHENAGVWLAAAARSTGLAATHANHYGEALFMTFYAGLLCGALWVTRTIGPGVHRARVLLVVGVLACASFFGLAVDLLDSVVLQPGTAPHALGTFVEDAGEFWSFNLAAVIVWAICARTMGEATHRTRAAGVAMRIRLPGG